MSLPELLERTRRPLGLSEPPPGSSHETKDGILPGVGPVLGFTMQHQQADFWCWAAIGVSVRRFLRGQTRRQCDLATEVFNSGLNCCQNKKACDFVQPLEVALTLSGVFAGMTGPVAPETVRAQIVDGRRPLCCAVRWYADGAVHFVVIHGFSVDLSGTAWVAVADPLYGPWKGKYDAFLSAYPNGAGYWIASYFTA
jgi:hypothetical protein